MTDVEREIIERLDKIERLLIRLANHAEQGHSQVYRDNIMHLLSGTNMVAPGPPLMPQLP